MTIYIWVLVEVSVVLAKVKLIDDLLNLIHDKILYIPSEFLRRDVIFCLFFPNSLKIQTRAKRDKISNTT